MRFAFDVTSSAKPHPGGIGTYGRDLVRGCARVAAAGDEVLAVVRPNRWTRRQLVADILPGRPVGLLADGLSRLTLGPLDAVHCAGAHLPRFGDFAKVATIHDLNVYEFPELSDADWLTKRRARIVQTVARADLIISTSEQGARAMHEHLGLSPERVRVVPMGVDLELFRPPPPARVVEVVQAHGLAGRPYLFHLGPAGARKNQEGLIAAFARAGLDDAWLLVLAGTSAAAGETLRELARSHGIADERVRLPGRVAAADLPALYAGSRGYVCPSLHEGFGLPVAEAQACGAPVAASNRGALPETVGDCGLVFDPTDEQDFAHALRRLALDEVLCADLRRRGPERAREVFCWDVLARRLLDVLREAVALRAG